MRAESILSEDLFPETCSYLKDFIKEYYDYYVFFRESGKYTFTLNNQSIDSYIDYCESYESGSLVFRITYIDSFDDERTVRVIVNNSFKEILNGYVNKVENITGWEFNYNDNEYKELEVYINELEEKFESFKLNNKLQSELKQKEEPIKKKVSKI